MKILAKQLKALANERRLNILILLGRGGVWTVGDIADVLKLSLRSTSKHLQLLKQAEFVDYSQSGPYIHYRLNKNNPLYKAVSILLK